MKKIAFYTQLFTLSMVMMNACPNLFAADALAREELGAVYEQYKNTPSNINEHLPVLRKLASQCSTVVEIGVESIVSTWGILDGLAENTSTLKSYTGIDVDRPPLEKLCLARRFAEENGIAFKFIQANGLTVDIEETDLLFIDSLHTYAHLTSELEKFSPHVKKYIAMHDTSAPWGTTDDRVYHGDYSEYPAWIDRDKRGLWPAIEDFLAAHPEWSLYERRFNNHGFTILKRKDI